jgi:membrane-associated phospholipid phosphatase
MSDASRPAGARLWYPIALAGLALVWLTMLLLGTGAVDSQFYEMLYAGGSPFLVRVAKLVTRVGDPTVVLASGFIVAGWLAFRRRIRLALTLTLVFLTGRALVEVQKYEVGRVRPGLEPHLVTAKTFSFVSGHAANSMIVLLALAIALVPEGKERTPIIVGAILASVVIGLSRIMLGVHWPSDVVGGWAYGALWVLLTLKPAERLLAVPFKR